MKNILTAFSFLTIIPVQLQSATEDNFKKSFKFFPMVGLFLGIIFYGVTFIPIGYELKSLLILFLWIILTGGFHLDGVADVFDAIGAVKNRERCFEIMKDSRIGAIGVIALISVILSKFIIIKNIVLLKPIFIILPPIAGRFAINFMAWRLNYAKESGLGKSIADNTDFKTFLFTLVFTLVTFIILSPKTIFVLIDLLFLLIALSIFVEKKFGGVTGDIFGLSVELSELVVLFGVTIFVI